MLCDMAPICATNSSKQAALPFPLQAHTSLVQLAVQPVLGVMFFFLKDGKHGHLMMPLLQNKIYPSY